MIDVEKDKQERDTGARAASLAIWDRIEKEVVPGLRELATVHLVGYAETNFPLVGEWRAWAEDHLEAVRDAGLPWGNASFHVKFEDGDTFDDTVAMAVFALRDAIRLRIAAVKFEGDAGPVVAVLRGGLTTRQWVEEGYQHYEGRLLVGVASMVSA